MSSLLSAEKDVGMGGDPTERSEAVLVSAAKSGDADAFVELSKRHDKKIISLQSTLGFRWIGQKVHNAYTD
jgi:hypothetical protein